MYWPVPNKKTDLRVILVLVNGLIFVAFFPSSFIVITCVCAYCLCERAVVRVTEKRRRCWMAWGALPMNKVAKRFSCHLVWKILNCLVRRLSPMTKWSSTYQQMKSECALHHWMLILFKHSLILTMLFWQWYPYLTFSVYGLSWVIWCWGWVRGSVVECWSLAGKLSLSCTRPVVDGWPLMWVKRPL